MTDMQNSQQERNLSLSVIAPIYNEVDNVGPLADDIVREVDKLGCSYEVILVNDGSSDGSTEALDAAAAKHKQVKVVHFARNAGQTIAIRAGLEHASGERIILMDGDRQNDPSDIGMLLQKLDEGFACVSGWRKNRQDAGIRKLPSKIANAIVRKVTRVPIHDLGCTLKAYRADTLDPEELFGELHRFLATFAATQGPITEVVVKHHPRTAGDSKYGMGRIPRVIADMFLIRILLKYRTRPSHLFAFVGQWIAMIAACFIGVGLIDLWVLGDFLYSKLAMHFWLIPVTVLGMGAMAVLSAGLVAELVMRNRYFASGTRPYKVARLVNFDENAQN